MTSRSRTADDAIGAVTLSLALLQGGMLWLDVRLMQDFDWQGGMKAILLLVAAVAAIALGARLPGAGRFGPPLLAGVALILAGAAFASPAPSSRVAACSVALLASAPLVLARAGVVVAAPRARVETLLAILCFVLALNHLRLFALYLHAPQAEDIATTTLEAVRAMRAGIDPYSVPLDLNPAYPDFSGFKYLPMMILAYAPLSLALGPAGLLLTNLLLDGLVTAAVMAAAARLSNRLGGLAAGCLALAAPVIPTQIFAHGVTDLAPVLPLVLALLVPRRRAGLVGALVGVSLATKMFPALAVGLCCLPQQSRLRYAACGLTGFLLPLTGFILWGPRDLLRNGVFFILSRPIDETSWMFGRPHWLPLAIKTFYLVYGGGVAIFVLTRPPRAPVRLSLIVATILAALLAGPGAHGNYIIWWLPFFCVLLGSAMAHCLPPREDDRTAANR